MLKNVSDTTTLRKNHLKIEKIIKKNRMSNNAGTAVWAAKRVRREPFYNTVGKRVNLKEIQNKNWIRIIILETADIVSIMMR